MSDQVKPSQARICRSRKHGAPLVVADDVCPHCRQSTKVHPWANKPGHYCVDCAEGLFPPDQCHVITYDENPYMQLDDGTLITTCLKCKAKRDGEEAGESDEQVAPSCDFHEPYFGAVYPDACCIEGYLWDLDSCHEPGGPLTSGGEIPCPKCNHEAWLEHFHDNFEEAGYQAADGFLPREYKHKKLIHEQPGDEAKVRDWWLAGYDQCIKENEGVSTTNSGIERIQAERKRQIEVEGWEPSMDDSQIEGQLAKAAQCYEAGTPDGWPWDIRWWKPTRNNRARDLEKAGALYLAEAERLERAGKASLAAAMRLNADRMGGLLDDMQG